MSLIYEPVKDVKDLKNSIQLNEQQVALLRINKISSWSKPSEV
jgi:hypothetical protein